MKSALQSGTITEARLNDAVARIISVKMAMGLVKDRNGNSNKNKKRIRATIEEN